jgi:hypothetical protein
MASLVLLDSLFCVTPGKQRTPRGTAHQLSQPLLHPILEPQTNGILRTPLGIDPCSLNGPLQTETALDLGKASLLHQMRWTDRHVNRSQDSISCGEWSREKLNSSP